MRTVTANGALWLARGGGLEEGFRHLRQDAPGLVFAGLTALVTAYPHPGVVPEAVLDLVRPVGVALGEAQLLRGQHHVGDDRSAEVVPHLAIARVSVRLDDAEEGEWTRPPNVLEKDSIDQKQLLHGYLRSCWLLG